MPAPVEAVLFDIDGVLVDVRRSYIDSIRKTVQLYLEKRENFVPSRAALLTRDDVHRFKLLGGFNNDWDAVYGLVVYFLYAARRHFRTTKQISIRDLARLKNFNALKKKVPIPCGPSGIKCLETKKVDYRLAKGMFQEIYLGTRLFREMYRRKPRFNRGPGLIREERLLISARILKALKRRGITLGIVTGRIAFEARYALKRFGLDRLFSVVVTHDDVEKAEKRSGRILRKPHPYPVLLAARKIGAGKRFLYVGDLPDDVAAANRAKKDIGILSAGFLYGADNRQAMARGLARARPDFLIRKPSELLTRISHDE